MRTYGGVDVLHRRLGGPQSRSGRCGVEKNLLPLPGIDPRLSISLPVAIPTEPSRIVTYKQTHHTLCRTYRLLLQ
jgi:hypothetical protein